MVPKILRLMIVAIAACSLPCRSQTVDISGTVTNQAAAPLAGARLLLVGADLDATTDDVGTYTLYAQATTRQPQRTDGWMTAPRLSGNQLRFSVIEARGAVRAVLFDLTGRRVATIIDQFLPKGAYAYPLAPIAAASQLCVLQVAIDRRQFLLQTILPVKSRTVVSAGRAAAAARSAPAKQSAVVDTLIASLPGYLTQRRPIESYSGVCDFTLTSGINVDSRHIKISGSINKATFNSVGNYGICPTIMLCANPDNSFDIAWHEAASEKVHILKCDSLGNKTAEIHPDCISGAGRTLGFAKVSDDDSYVVGYAKDNSFANENFEFWITRFDAGGALICSTRIFGEKIADSVWAKGEPGRASSGRIMYNPVTKRIAFYCGHSMKWDDNVRHQGGYMGFLDQQGTQLTIRDDWYCSHNFDQRMLVVGGHYYTLAHGDAYPRALVFGKWRDDPDQSRCNLVNEQYFNIPGSIGDNTTNTQTGGLVWLHDTTMTTPSFSGPLFGVVYGTKIGRSNYDLCFKRITGSGAVLDSVWLTANPADQLAMFPRMARYSSGNVLVAWRQSIGGSVTTEAMVLDYAGQTVQSQTRLSVPLCEYYDLVNLPNGDIVWATATASDTMGVFRIAAR